MGDIADDDLLNDDEEFDHEGYNLSDKEEDALLDGEEYSGGHLSNDSVHSDKKQTHEDSDDLEDDILDLDVEEDFQDVEAAFEEKPNENRQEGKFSKERPATSSNTNTNKVPVRAQTTKKVVPVTKSQSETNKIKVQNTKKAPPKVEKRWRGTGRGNFQSRGNFIRNNPPKERRLERRKTVYINPKYEGIVHINENTARLAWDNASYQQNNSHYIQPWASGSVPGNSDASFQDPSLLINNLVSEIASISQTPTNLFQVPAVQPSQTQNFFEPPRPSQPPPLIFQISNRPTFPTQTPLPTYQSTRPEFNSQSLTDKYKNESNSYGLYNNYSYNRSSSQNYSLEAKKNFTASNYDNRNMSYNKTLVSNENQYESNKSDNYKSSFLNEDSYKSNFSYPNNYYKSSYSNQGSYQTRSSSYLSDGFESGKTVYNKINSYSKPITTYETGNLYKTDSKEIGYNRNTNVTTLTDRNLIKNENLRQNIYSSTANVNSKQPISQSWSNYNNYYKNDYNKTNFNQASNRTFANKNLTNQQNSNRRPASNERVELPEKKPKTEENIKEVETRNEEVKRTTDTTKQQVSSNKTTKEDDEDEEMRLYRLKIEEQKREREKVLKMKEERRKMMLQQQKEKENSVDTVPEKQQQEQQPAVSAVTTNLQNKNYKQNNTTVIQPQRRNYQQQEQPAMTTTLQNKNTTVPQQQRRNYQQLQVPQPAMTTTFQNKTYQPGGTTVPQQQRTNYNQQPVNRIPVLTTTKSQYLNTNNAQSSSAVEDELPNFTFKVSNDLQKTALKSANVPKTEASSSSFMSNRVVVVKNSNNQKGGVVPNSNIVKTVAVNNEASNENADVGQGLSSFFNNRKVLKKDNTLINTRLVVISNLAASTTQNKLVAMTRGIGEIQKLQMDKLERTATILFKSVASAHAFFKKYQRHMLDLSVIEVKLEPMI